MIALGSDWGFAALRAEEQYGVQSQPGRSYRGGPAVIGLDGSAGEKHIGGRVPCRRDMELELPDFVAGEAEAGEVVAFDPDGGPSPRSGQTIQTLERGRKGCKWPPGWHGHHRATLPVPVSGTCQNGRVERFVPSVTEDQTAAGALVE